MKQEEIIDRCPLLYRFVKYFACGNGWLPIIGELSDKLEAIIESLPWPEDERPCCADVKEKYGTLRFYMHGETEEMGKLIEEAEDLSEKTCEMCGKPGTTQTNMGWTVTRCGEGKCNGTT